ncbi:hypothetical protein KW787_02865 [Candidatus Pacearchaeota archaeon]|nr:hypothetical protein [Candidatus Pacearchaeota archaeon]
MSDLLRLLSSLSLIILISSSSALELGISPPVIEFNSSLNERVCKKVYIYSNEDELNVSLYEKWTNEKEDIKEISIYNLDSKEGCELDYPRNLVLNKTLGIDVCFSALQIGDCNGVLIVQAGSRSASVGSWIRNSLQLRNTITGFSIADSFSYGFLYWELGILFILASLLILLILSKRKRISKKVYILCFAV